MEGFNLELVKQEVEKRKQQTQASGNAPKDGKQFLSELVTSVYSGVHTPTVEKINTIAENSDKFSAVKVMSGHGQNRPAETYRPSANNGGVYPQPQQLNETEQQHAGRDSYFDQQMEKGYDLLRSRSQQTPSNAGLSQVLNEYSSIPFAGSNVGGNMNASAINEHISKSFNDLMSGSNMVKLVEGAYKNMINEMYAREKVENVLVEIVQGETFKKIMKKMIVDVLLEIQSRNKKA